MKYLARDLEKYQRYFVKVLFFIAIPHTFFYVSVLMAVARGIVILGRLSICLFGLALKSLLPITPILISGVTKHLFELANAAVQAVILYHETQTLLS